MTMFKNDKDKKKRWLEKQTWEVFVIQVVGELFSIFYSMKYQHFLPNPMLHDSKPDSGDYALFYSSLGIWYISQIFLEYIFCAPNKNSQSLKPVK